MWVTLVVTVGFRKEKLISDLENRVESEITFFRSILVKLVNVDKIACFCIDREAVPWSY